MMNNKEAIEWIDYHIGITDYDKDDDLLKALKTAKKALMTNHFNLDDDSFGAVLNCAVRYSMGRQSYMPSLVVDFITPLLPYITQKTLGVFKQDYEPNQRTADENGWAMFGDTKIDKPLWDKFYADVCAEIEKRNDKGIT